MIEYNRIFFNRILWMDAFCWVLLFSVVQGKPRVRQKSGWNNATAEKTGTNEEETGMLLLFCFPLGGLKCLSQI